MVTKNPKIEANDNLFRLEEMFDEMKKSMENVKDVVKKQEHLIEVLEKSKEKDDFKDFITSMKEEIKKIEESKITLARRIDCIRDVIDDCHEDEGKKITVLDLLEGLGVFN